MDEFIKKLPKAELHIHFDGALESELLLLIAERNKIKIPYNTVEEVSKSCIFHTLNEFLNCYSNATKVLQKEEDFYDLTLSYLKKASSQGVLYAEIFFDIQTYAQRGIKPDVIINGTIEALKTGEKEFGITSFLILCFMRQLSEQDAFSALKAILPYREKIIGVGLACNEKGKSGFEICKCICSGKILWLQTHCTCRRRCWARIGKRGVEVIKA